MEGNIVVVPTEGQQGWGWYRRGYVTKYTNVQGSEPLVSTVFYEAADPFGRASAEAGTR